MSSEAAAAKQRDFQDQVEKADKSDFTDDGYRGQGVARKLLSMAVDHLEEIGCTSVVLHSSAAGKSLHNFQEPAWRDDSHSPDPNRHCLSPSRSCYPRSYQKVLECRSLAGWDEESVNGWIRDCPS